MVGLILPSACVGEDGTTPFPVKEPAARLVQIQAPIDGTPSGDSVPLARVAFVMPHGGRQDVDAMAIGFVPRWRQGAALVDSRRRLYEITAAGQRRMLTTGATGEMATSSDGSLLAYVVAVDVLGELRIHDGISERVIASGLASAGVLRFTTDSAQVLFVGARPGGVIGVWVASVVPGLGTRCLTNCSLVTGEPWQDRFVPPPSRPADFQEWRTRMPSSETHSILHEPERRRQP